MQRRSLDPLRPSDIARGDGRDVILQAFHWNLVKTDGGGTMDGRGESWWRVLARMAPDVAALGATIAYLPPPWRDDSSWERGGGEGYFWHDFDLDSRYGTKAELVACVSALHRAGVRVIVDLVVNHRDRKRMRRDVWPWPGPQWARGGGDTGAGFEAGENDMALRDPVVHARLLAAMNELLDDCDVDGWRWDFVWGYSVDDVIALLRETPKAEYFSVGEYWQGDPRREDDPLIARYGADERDRILGWACETRSLAYDVLLKGRIQDADARKLPGAMATGRRHDERACAVTFVDNHDTGASPWCRTSDWGQKRWPCPDAFKSRAYAFVLSMPGTPSIYWPDAFDWGMRDELTALTRARKRAGIVAGSAWTDLRDRHTGLAAYVKDADGTERLAISIDSDFADPGEGFELAYEKKGEWTVWVK